MNETKFNGIFQSVLRSTSSKAYNTLLDLYSSQFPLFTGKRLDYQERSKALALIINGKHQTEEGLQTYQGVKDSMNTHSIFLELETSYYFLYSSKNPPLCLESCMDMLSLYGNIRLRKLHSMREHPLRLELLEYLMMGSNFKHLYSVKRLLGNVRAYITLQGPQEDKVFSEWLVPDFGMFITGFTDAEIFMLSIRKRKRDDHWTMIPYFYVYPLVGYKFSNFLMCKEVVELMKSKAHLTPEDLAKIKEKELLLNKKTLQGPETGTLPIKTKNSEFL